MTSRNGTPLVSVRIPVYNHEKYINECLDSVLAQTFQDFEIIITDDGSTDNSVELIEQYKDPRIKLNVFAHNRGCAVAIADCGERSSGKYIANFCSDDVWEPDKLEKQVAFLEENPQFDAVFTRVVFINEKSKERHRYLRMFECENRSKEEWLSHFFYFGNCLCIPSVLIKKDVYQELNLQDKRMANLLDFDLWVKFCFGHELYIIDEKLTKFRMRSSGANASGLKKESISRINFEYKQILNHYLDIDAALFKKCFPEYARYLKAGELTADIIPYFLGRLAYDTKRKFARLWGLETIFELMKDEEIVQMLIAKCDFDYSNLHKLAGDANVFDVKKTFKQTKPMRLLINLARFLTRGRI